MGVEGVVTDSSFKIILLLGRLPRELVLHHENSWH